MGLNHYHCDGSLKKDGPVQELFKLRTSLKGTLEIDQGVCKSYYIRFTNASFIWNFVRNISFSETSKVIITEYARQLLCCS